MTRVQRFVLAVALLVTAGASHAQWRQDGKELPDEPWRKSEKGFGALLLFTDRPEEFFEAWAKPDSPGYKPAISSPGEIHRGARVVAVVLFTDCRPNDKGECDAEVDFKLLRPDGTVYGEHKAAELWKARPSPPAGNLQLGVGNLAFRVESDDPLGQYTLQARVRDKVAAVEIPLIQQINVLPATAQVADSVESGKLPEPSSWSFPDVVESARAIAPRNVEGRVFNRFGLAYSREELDALPVATMPAEELQKYADIVTHAYPDAVFRQIPESCNHIALEGMNTTAVAGLAFMSLHAVELQTRERATTCLAEVQRRWKKR